jgi:type I restriction enzyme S subunit
VNGDAQNGLPLGWTSATLGELTEADVEQLGPRGSGDFTYVDITSVDNRLKRIVQPKALPVSEAPSRARQILKAGDVLVSMTRPNLNAVALVPPGLDGAAGSTGFHVLRTKWIASEWIYYLVQTVDFVRSMSSLVLGVLYPAVRPKDIKAFAAPIPPLAEQRRIVAEIEKQFTRLDAAVAALRRVQANLKRYRASVLKAACEGRLVATEAELARAEGRDYEPADKLLARILKERRARWEADQLARMQAAGRVPKDDKWTAQAGISSAWSAPSNGAILKPCRRRSRTAAKGSIRLREARHTEERS